MTSRTSVAGTLFAVAGAGLFLLDGVMTVWSIAPVATALSDQSLWDPAKTAAVAGEVLVTVAVRNFSLLPALLLVTLALVTMRYRARWFFWFLMVAGAVMLLLVPVGTGFGIFFLRYAWRRRTEFAVPAKHAVST